MNEVQTKLVNRIIDGKNPVCIHILGQSLADTLSDIIREQQKEIIRLKTELDKMSVQ